MSDIRLWLEDLSPDQYANLFEENRLGLDALLEIDHDVLYEIGVAAAGNRIAILSAIRVSKTATAAC